MGLVLDTSVLISAERKKFNLDDFFQIHDRETFFISSITLSELWHGCHRAKGAAIQGRLKSVQHIESLIPVIKFGTEEALVHAKIWSGLEKTGQGIGLHDLIIAATALTHDHSLATLNENEFKRVPGLKLAQVKRFLL